MKDMRRGSYWVPDNPRTFVLPGDAEALDKAWDAYLGTTTPVEDLGDEGSKREVDMSPEAVAERARLKARHDEAVAFIKGYTGSFGLILDIRANPKWGTKYLRLSERQVEAVLASRDRDIARAAEAEAGLEQARINTDLWHDDEYTAWKEQNREPSTAEAAGLAPQPAPRAPMAEVSDGWYVVEGEPWKVQWNREHTRKYAKRLVANDGTGSWEYVPGGLGIVAQKGSPMTADVAQAYGKLYGVCAICGRTLTDEVSIADGIGPVCKSKL